MARQIKRKPITYIRYKDLVFKTSSLLVFNDRWNWLLLRKVPIWSKTTLCVYKNDFPLNFEWAHCMERQKKPFLLILLLRFPKVAFRGTWFEGFYDDTLEPIRIEMLLSEMKNNAII